MSAGSSVAVVGPGNLVSLAAQLGDRTNDRLRKTLTTYALGSAVFGVGRAWYQRTRAAAAFSVAVPGNDDLYPDLHAWLVDRIPEKRRRAVLARSQRSQGQLIEVGDTPEPRLHLSFDGSRSQSVIIAGHPIRIEVERPDMSRFDSRDMNERPQWASSFERMVFTARDAAARDAVLRFLGELLADRKRQPPRLYMALRWGEWRRQELREARPANSVVLAGTQFEDLSEDLRSFLANESAYSRLGIPWHRGWLFEGPPGCGKTSAAQALAAHYGLDIYFLPLSAIENDSNLLSLVATVKPRSMLLLEDIDVVHGAKVRDDSEPGVSLSGLLNALDGAVTPTGIVTVMTTNDAATLDEALTRVGRVDRSEYFGLADHDQLTRLAAVLVGRPVDLHDNKRPVLPAAAVECAKRHLGDPEAIAGALKDLAART